MRGQYKGISKSGLQRDEIAPGTQVTVCVSLSRDDLRLLDERARNHKVERSSFVRRLIRDGYLSTCSVCKSPTSLCTCGGRP